MAKAAIARPNFGSVLDKPAGEVERPRPMPVGQYVWIVQGQPKFDKSSKKQTEYVEFTLKCVEALDTVDADELEDWLTSKDGTKRKLGDATQRLTFYLTEGALWRLKDFLAHCGLDVEGDASLRQLIPETTGCQVIGTIAHESSDDGTAVFGRVRSTAPVE